MLETAKKRRFLRFIHHNNNHSYHHQLLQTVFSECTEVVTTSLMTLETILPKECSFIIG